MTRTCQHCGAEFTTDVATKRFCDRRCKERNKDRRRRLELAAYRTTNRPPSRWRRLRVALRWAIRETPSPTRRRS